LSGPGRWSRPVHLAYKMHFMFELLADGAVEKLCNKIAEKGIPYGFGGIARVGELIPPAESIIAEHYRLGSTMVILSRSFCNTGLIKDEKQISDIFSSGVKAIRDFEAELQTKTVAISKKTVYMSKKKHGKWPMPLKTYDYLAIIRVVISISLA
jgi:hypothetical protein